MKEKQSAIDLARILAVLGGLVTIIAGVQGIMSLLGHRNTPSIELVTSSTIYAIVVIALGLIGIMGSRQVKSLAWDIILIIVGLVAYQFDGGFPWLFGPVLIVLAGIVGVVGQLA